MMRLFYHCLVTLLLPFALLRLLWRSRRNPDYRQRLGERFAFTVADTQNALWIHTVSVGEFLATLPLIERLLADGETVLITTTTPTGSAMVRDKLEKYGSERIAHQYLPFDAPFLVKRFLDATQPRLAVFVETEIWANYLRQLKQRDIPALLINARLSEKSFNGYAKLGRFARETVGDFTLIACQNSDSCQRFTALGAEAIIVGNVKFDLSAPDDLLNRKNELKHRLNNRHFVLAASTHKGEEAILFNAYRQQKERRLFVIAPRHPERSESIVACAESFGLRAQCYTQIGSLPADTEVLVVDTLGQLLTFYALADYAIIGGSFVPHGGHNPLESVLFATPCLIGPHYFNFERLIEDMLVNAAIDVLPETALFCHEPSAESGINGQRFLSQNQGATKQYQALIQSFAGGEKHAPMSAWE